VHYRNHRHFLAQGGLFGLTTQHNLEIDKQRILAGGTFAELLVHQP
jgi:hypothetical protein